MKSSIKKFRLQIIMLAMGNVGCIAGVPDYPGDVRRYYAVDRGEEEEKLRLIERLKCSVEFLEKSSDSDIRAVNIMTALNPGVTKEISLKLMNRRDPYTVAAIALSEYTKPCVLRTILNLRWYPKERLQTIYDYLAANENLSEDDLVGLYDSENRPNMRWFATNINCPKIIKDAIRELGPSDALDRLIETERRFIEEGKEGIIGDKSGYKKEDEL